MRCRVKRFCGPVLSVRAQFFWSLRRIRWTSLLKMYVKMWTYEKSALASTYFLHHNKNSASHITFANGWDLSSWKFEYVMCIINVYCSSRNKPDSQDQKKRIYTFPWLLCTNLELDGQWLTRLCRGFMSSNIPPPTQSYCWGCIILQRTYVCWKLLWNHFPLGETKFCN